MHTIQNVQNMQNMQNSLLLTERISALWAVYGYFCNNNKEREYTLNISEDSVGRRYIDLLCPTIRIFSYPLFNNWE